MSILIPAHQFEIRYKKLINFKKIIEERVAPFGKTALDIVIENDNIKDMVCNLVYENYLIHIRWDRILFRYEGTIENYKTMVNSNSVAETIFFRIFESVKQDPGFGGVLNYLNFVLAVKINNDGTAKKERENFINKYIVSKNLNYFMNDTSDIGLLIDKKDKNTALNIVTGPYIGFEDIKKRNVTPSNKEIKRLLEEKTGQMLDLKVHEVCSSINFAKYKESVNQSIEIIERLWN